MDEKRTIIPTGQQRLDLENPLGLVPDEDHPGMWRLIWANGDKSKDFYNLTWAKDNLRNYAQKRYNMQLKGPRPPTKKAVRAFK